MLDELLGLNPRTVVVLKDSNPVLMPWIDRAPAVLEVWNQGSEDGHVVADLLFGVVNPSGKVPTTYPVTEDDTLYAGHPERYPGTDEGDGYPGHPLLRGPADRLPLVPGPGHRAAVRLRLRPVLHHLRRRRRRVDAPDGARAPVTVTATVTNTGPVAGAEVVQVYLGYPVDGSRRSGWSGSARCSWSPARRAGDHHGRPGRDPPPVRRLGLRHPELRRSRPATTPSMSAPPPTTPRTPQPLPSPECPWSPIRFLPTLTVMHVTPGSLEPLRRRATMLSSRPTVYLNPRAGKPWASPSPEHAGARQITVG